jgi:hypothetical protein
MTSATRRRRLQYEDRAMSERTSQSDEQFFRERGFGLKIGFGQRPALLVIDMVKAFTNPCR